jgi:hypothetical protein
MQATMGANFGMVILQEDLNSKKVILAKEESQDGPGVRPRERATRRIFKPTRGG